MESSMPLTMAMDEFVMNGKGDAATAAKTQGFWTWSTQEIRDLLSWMRKYNLNSANKRKLRVLGIDCQDGMAIEEYLVQAFKTAGLKDFPQLTDPAWRYEMRRVAESAGPSESLYDDSATFSQIESAIHQASGKLTKSQGQVLRRMAETYRQHREVMRLEFLREDRDNLARSMAKRDIDFKALVKKAEEETVLGKSAKEQLAMLSARLGGGDIVRGSAKNLRLASRDLRAVSPEYASLADALDLLAIVVEISRFEAIPRDAAMAENVRWALTDYFPGQRAAIWTHNSHAGSTFIGGKPVTMGAYLRKSLGTAYYPIGFSVGKGRIRALGNDGRVGEVDLPHAKAGSVDDHLSKLAGGTFFVRLKGSETDLPWMKRKLPWRNVGHTYIPTSPDKYYEELAAGDLFQGLVFIPEVSPSRKLD
jgi:erythromycin esterase-like protein